MKGQCLCGKIQFQVDEIPGLVFNCHCSRCRSSHGADYATQVFANRSSLSFMAGQEFLKEFESTGGLRCFCSECGSRLMNYAKNDGDYLSVAAACLDQEFVQKMQITAHCFTGSKAIWHTIDESIPSYETLPESL
ncbi:MAG: GFA family protein [Arenicella sp.]